MHPSPTQRCPATAAPPESVQPSRYRGRVLVVPVSAVLAAWGNAWLVGHIGLDEAVDAVERAHGPQVVAASLAGPDEPDDTPLRQHLAALRAAGLSRLRLALPASGDPLGMSGPPQLNAAGIEAGEVTLADVPGEPLGLVPAEDRRGSSYVGVRWTAHAARPNVPDTPSLPEAEQQLTVAMRDSTETLLQLDVPRWHPDAAQTLAALRGGPADEPPIDLPPGYPPRAHRVAALAARLALVLDIALSDEGGAVAASEMEGRRGVLRDLDRAIRRARVAAYNCVAGASG